MAAKERIDRKEAESFFPLRSLCSFAAKSLWAEDLAAVDGASYTYAYNDANELTAMNLNGVETHFTYDDWGRTASKYVGDGSVLHASWSPFEGGGAERRGMLGQQVQLRPVRMANSSAKARRNIPHPRRRGHPLQRRTGTGQAPADADPAMEREWYRYDAGWNVMLVPLPW